MKPPIGLIVTAVIIIVLGILGCAAFESVPAGHVGVIQTFGEVDMTRTLPEGVAFLNPLADVVPIDCRVQKEKASYAYASASKDMQEVTVELVINYRIRNDAAAKVYQQVGLDIFDKVVNPAAQEAVKAETAKHSASDILAARAQIRQTVQTNLIAWVQKYGIDIVEMSLSDIDFDPHYNSAIRDKQVQEQKALQKTYELQSAEKQAEIAKAEAAGKANAAIEEARGAAQAILTRAEAEAKANTMIAQSLSGPQGALLIQVRQLEKWNGTLPTVMAGDSGMPVLLGVAGK